MKSNSDANRGLSESGGFGLLRSLSPIAVVAGAVGSLALMFYDHLHSPPVLLVLFTGWVLLPFLALLLAHFKLSSHWTVTTRATLYGVMLVVSVASLAVYWFVVFGPAHSQQTFMFLAVPCGAWGLLLIGAAIAAIARSR